MIKGIGVDLIQISRISPWLENKALCNRYFHADELAFVASRGKGAPASFAARFAAKEAFIKALGSGFSQISLKEICILNDENNKPYLRLYGCALEIMQKRGIEVAHVSLAHEANHAIAHIILEG